MTNRPMDDDQWVNDHPRDYVGCQEAKQDYFLDPSDLKLVPYKTWGGGQGCGAPRKLYVPDQLEYVACQKYGYDGLEKKRAARVKRMANKRKKEEEAGATDYTAVATNMVVATGPTDLAKTKTTATSSVVNDENDNPQIVKRIKITQSAVEIKKLWNQSPNSRV